MFESAAEGVCVCQEELRRDWGEAPFKRQRGFTFHLKANTEMKATSVIILFILIPNVKSRRDDSLSFPLALANMGHVSHISDCH